MNERLECCHDLLHSSTPLFFPSPSSRLVKETLDTRFSRMSGTFQSKPILLSPPVCRFSSPVEQNLLVISFFFLSSFSRSRLSSFPSHLFYAMRTSSLPLDEMRMSVDIYARGDVIALVILSCAQNSTRDCRSRGNHAIQFVCCWDVEMCAWLIPPGVFTAC